MKLSEALILRADYQKKVEQIRNRLTKVAKVQEDETPSEDPQTLLTELGEVIKELEDLIKNINRTNSQTIFEENITLSDALAKRDALKLKCSIYRSLIEASADPYSRYSRSEIKYFSTVNIAELQNQIDQMSKQYRELDTKIQASNWTTDLITDS